MKNYDPPPETLAGYEEKLRARFLQIGDAFPLSGRPPESRPVDYAFLEEKISFRKKWRRRLIQSVAAAAMLFIASGIMALWLNETRVAALKTSAENAVLRHSGPVPPKEAPCPVKEGCSSITISSEDQIPAAKRFLPDLPVPALSGSGYGFKQLDVQKMRSGKFRAAYQLSGQDGAVYTVTAVSCEKESTSVLPESSKKIDFHDLSCYFCTDPVSGTQSCFFIKESSFLTVTGPENVSPEELLSVADLFR